jgi:hypothetical protein
MHPSRSSPPRSQPDLARVVQRSVRAPHVCRLRSSCTGSTHTQCTYAAACDSLCLCGKTESNAEQAHTASVAMLCPNSPPRRPSGLLHGTSAPWNHCCQNRSLWRRRAREQGVVMRVRDAGTRCRGRRIKGVLFLGRTRSTRRPLRKGSLWKSLANSLAIGRKRKIGFTSSAFEERMPFRNDASPDNTCVRVEDGDFWVSRMGKRRRSSRHHARWKRVESKRTARALLMLSRNDFASTPRWLLGVGFQPLQLT